MKMNFKIIGRFAIVATTITLMGSCSIDKDSSGYEYMPDMYRSAAIEPYVDYGQVQERENMDMKMTLSSLVPPAGTVPYYGTDSTTVSLMLPYFRKAHISFKLTHGMFDAELTDTNEYLLAAADKNPLALTADNVDAVFSEGKELFMSKCAHCHGKSGDGNGSMVESGAYVGVADYANLTELGDGQMFYSIYYGKGMMGAHNSIINKREIWTLVHYIRKLQNGDYGSMDAVVDVADVELEEEVVEHPEHSGH